MLRRYAQITGAGLLLLGGACMLGVGTTNPAVDLDHLFAGALLAYAGLADRDDGCARGMVAGLGITYLLAGALGYVAPALLMGPSSDIGNGIVLNHAVHLAVGALNVAAVVLSSPNGRRRGAETRGQAGCGLRRDVAGVPRALR